MKREFKIPSIIGIFLLFAAIIGGVYLTNIKTSVQTKASGDCSPTNIQITNITHKSADVSFSTTATCNSNVLIDGKTYGDVRFSLGNRAEIATRTHYFQIDGLDVSTGYRFTVTSGGQNYSLPGFELTTTQAPSTDVPASKLAWGKVFASGSTPASDAIVYLNIPGALPLSSYVTTDGNWNIPLSVSIDESRSGWFVVPPDMPEDIVVISNDGKTTQITNNTNNNNPVPNIIVGQDSFSTPTPLSQTSLSQSLPTTNQIKLSIKNPTSLEKITTSRPDFFGTASPQSTINLTLVSSTTLSDQVLSDNMGVWHWSPSNTLLDGDYTLSVVSGSEQVNTRFSVVSLGNGDGTLAFSASSSATLAPSPTSVPTIEPTVIPTPVPTEIIRVSHPSTASGTPVSGSISVTYAVVFVSLVLFVISFLWYSHY